MSDSGQGFPTPPPSGAGAPPPPPQNVPPPILPAPSLPAPSLLAPPVQPGGFAPPDARFGGAPPTSLGQRTMPAPPSVPPGSDGGQRNLVPWFLGLGVLVIALLGLLVFLFAGGSDDQGIALEGRDAQVSPDDEPDETEEPVEEEEEERTFFGDPFRPDSVAADASSVWVSDAACGVVVQVDKATEEVVGAVTVGNEASGVAVAAGSVWVGTRDAGTVARIDPARLAVSGSIPVGGSALGVTARGNDVWATDPFLGVVYQIDARSSSLVATIEVGTDPHHVAIGDGAVWVTNSWDDTVSIINPSTGSTREVLVGASPLHVELGGGSAWVTDSADGAVRRLDERTGETEAVIDTGVWPHALAYANGFVWVGTESGTFWKVDPSNNTSTRVEDADFSTIDTVVDGNNVWIADASGGTLVRFDASSGSVGSVVDLREFGDCQTFQDDALEEPPPPTNDNLWRVGG